MIDLLICDDSAEARLALRTMLADHDEISLVGEAASGDEAVALALSLRPDVVLMDLHMPIVDGVAATRRIAKLLPSTRVVALSGADDSGSVSAMMEAGAAAYLVKGAPLWEIERAIAGRSDPLVRLAHGLAKATNHSGIGTTVCRELVQLTGAWAAVAYVAAPDVALSLAGSAGKARPRRLTSAPSLALRAFAGLATTRADDDDLRELARAGLRCSAALGIPLVEDGTALGALLLTMPPGTEVVADEGFVGDVATLAASAFAAQRRLALTHAEARRDALTGLANRRALDERLEEALRAAAVVERELALVLFDLDDFKRYNDEGGHATGDAVLSQVARAATRVLRVGEELFRIGGDEFAVVVEADEPTALQIAERIRDALSAQRRGGVLPTISAGVAVYPRDARTMTDLLAAADEALYASKRRGKSRISSTRRRGGRRSGGPEPADVPLSAGSRGPRVLFVDDDPRLLTLLRTTLELADIELEEAVTMRAAAAAIFERPPDVVVLDLGLPDGDGLDLCRRLKSSATTRRIGVVVLTGAGEEAEAAAVGAGADAFLHKPFSPLELLAVVERLAGGFEAAPQRRDPTHGADDQILLYAGDLRRLLDLERRRQQQLQQSYRQTVAALAGALESKDVGTGSHSQRVQRYAVELARAIEPALLADPSVEYGFLLHDVGKIGIPDHVLQKTGPLDDSELRLMRTHTILGEQLLRDVELLHGDGLRVVRGHHERWDGLGYPDGLSGRSIPLAARVFSVADALDAITSDRPYRPARSWEDASAEILSGRGRQFDPDVADAFRERSDELHAIRQDLAAA